MDIYVILKCAVTIIATLIGFIVLPYISAKLNREQYETLILFIKSFVRAAEQIYGNENNSSKKKYVMTNVKKFMSSKLGVDLTDEQISDLIEGAVNEIKYSSNYTRNVD